MQIELLVPDLMSHSRLRHAFATAAAELEEMPGALLVVDVGPMAALGWEKAIRRAQANSVRVIAFGPHSMAPRLAACRRLGVDVVAVNSEMLTDPVAVVRRLTAEPLDPQATT